MGQILCILFYCSSFYLFETLEGTGYHKIPPIYFPFPLKKKKNIHTVSWSKKPHVTRLLEEAVTPKADGKLSSFQQCGPQSQRTSLKLWLVQGGRSEWPTLPSCLGQDGPGRGHSLLYSTLIHLQGPDVAGKRKGGSPWDEKLYSFQDSIYRTLSQVLTISPI